MKFLIFSILMIMATMSRSCEPSIDQGLAGELRWLEGNLMPTISEDPPETDQDKKGEPVQREVHIYELTSMDEAEANGPFYHNIKTRLVEKVRSDKDGYFEVALPVGEYSVFVQEDQGLFASVFDGQGNINPVEVKENEVSKISIDINYKAAY